MSTVNAASPLGIPVLSVDEQIVFVPPAGLRVSNRARKLLFFFEANCRHRVRELGERSEVALSAGDILVLPHACQQEYISPRGKTTRLHALRLIIAPEVIPPLLPGQTETLRGASPRKTPSGEESVEAFITTKFMRIAYLQGGVNPEVRETMARLRRECEAANDSRAFNRYRVGAICLELLVLVARLLDEGAMQGMTRNVQGGLRVEEVREFVIKHLDQPLRLEGIASHLGITPEHLARVWKKSTGTTLFDYVRRARIERAKSLLTSSDSNLSQIASECGFSSLALFSRTFKKEVGVSPNQYRQRLVRFPHRSLHKG